MSRDVVVRLATDTANLLQYAGLAPLDRAWQTPAELVHACRTGADGRSDVKWGLGQPHGW